MTPCPKPVKREAKARKPMKRSWIKRKPPKRLKRAGANREFIQWVRTQMCVLLSDSCEGRTHAHHAIHRSQGGKDRDAIPFCMRHHWHWHNARGPFGGWSKMERFAWAVKAIANTQLDYQLETGKTL